MRMRHEHDLQIQPSDGTVRGTWGAPRAMDSEVADYIAQMAHELAEMAAEDGLEALAVVLHMADVEAIKAQSGRGWLH